MTRWLNSLQPWALLLLRLALGAAMVFHGWPKVLPPNPFHGHILALEPTARFAHYVQNLGLPPWLAYVSAFTELVGGLCLLLGLLTRFAALLVTINMIVALATVDARHGYAASELALAFATMAFLVLTAGPGKLALDRRLGLT